MDDIKSISAQELVMRWIKSKDPAEIKHLDAEIERRLNSGDEKPIKALSGAYQNAFHNVKPAPKKGSAILSDMENPDMVMIWNRAKKLLGSEKAEALRYPGAVKHCKKATAVKQRT